jgi:hypothetical protein
MKLNHPFRVMFYAPSYSGKTTLITNMIKDKNTNLKPTFKKNIFVFQPTAFSDKSYEGLVPDKNVFENYDEKTITEIMKESKDLIKGSEAVKGSKKFPVLMIFDDAILEVDNNRKGLMSLLFTKGRHYNISVILTSQQAKLAIPTWRLNASHNILLPQKLNPMELDAVSELTPLDKKKFMSIIEDIRDSEPYTFLVIDMTTPDINKMFLKNGTKFYKIRDKELIDSDPDTD